MGRDAMAARGPGLAPAPDVASPRREHAMMVSVKHNLPWCPCCQSEHVKLGTGIVGGIEFFVLMCQACGFRTPEMLTGEEAIAEWQRHGFW
jgi:hypothetical protein